MPWRLILFIFLIIVIVVFMGANLDNKSPISLIFHATQPVPVYLIILYSFCAGVAVMLPFTIRKKKDSDKKDEKETKSVKKNDELKENKFGNFFAKKHKNDKADKNDIKTPQPSDTNTYEDKI